jgi:hypothetical protein
MDSTERTANRRPSKVDIFEVASGGDVFAGAKTIA